MVGSNLGAIGLFDSGVGGLTIHLAVTERLPMVNFIYLADQAHMPYGARSGEEIVQLTRAGCQRLFDAGCDLVILACNTASAIALHRLQQSWLPGIRQAMGRRLNVLGIVVPTIEVVTGLPWNARNAPTTTSAHQIVGVFATQATVRSKVYEIEISKRRTDLSVISEACPGLAALVEEGAPRKQIARVIDDHVREMLSRTSGPLDRVILGSTHYELVADLFCRSLPPTTELVHQPHATAYALETYLKRHPEFNTHPKGLRRFLTTSVPGTQHALAEACWGGPISFDAA